MTLYLVERVLAACLRAEGYSLSRADIERYARQRERDEDREAIETIDANEHLSPACHKPFEG